MKILFIAPLPPPITGHSLVSKVLLDELERTHEVNTVDLSKDSFKEGGGFKRIMEVFGIIKAVWSKKKGCERIYLTISESFAGNVKDLFIYLVCFRSLPNMFIHLHGGSIKRLLWDKYNWLARINYFFIRRMGGVIISGKSHIPIFDKILPATKIHIVPNFAQEYVFAEEEKVREKYDRALIRILYMSNLIPKKGYNELADAFLRMNDTLKNKVQIDFAGGFESDEPKNIFLNKIKGYPQVTYHGLVSEDKKKELFANAHIFCLPTTYFEGQPISILEAYASGCVVVTTGQSGILDIFEDGVNGFQIEEPLAPSIEKTITGKVDGQKEVLRTIGLNNLATALKQYRVHIYNKALKEILESN